MKTKNLTALTAALIGLTSMQGSAFAQKPPSGGTQLAQPLMVVDKNGRVLGRFGPGHGWGPGIFTIFNSSVVAIPIRVSLKYPADGSGNNYSPDYFELSPIAVFFSNSSCTGQAYVSSSYTPGVRTGGVIKSGSKSILYMANSAPLDSPVAIYAILSGGVCDTGTSAGYPIPMYGLSPATPMDVTGQFEEPLRIQ